MTANAVPDEVWTIEETAEYLRTSRDQLAQLRYRGTGPRFIKITGRQVRYRRSDVDEWLSDRSRTQSARRVTPAA